MLNVLRAAVIIVAVVVTACSQTPKEDPRVAELQKQLAEVKKDLDASKQQPSPAPQRVRRRRPARRPAR